MPGSASYSAQMPMVRGPDPAVATKAVGRSHTPASTENPPPDSASAAQCDERSSSKASSGWPCTVWESSTSAPSAFRTSSCAAALASMDETLLRPSTAPRWSRTRNYSGFVTISVDDGHDVAGADGVAWLDLDLLDRSRLLGVDVVLHL